MGFNSGFKGLNNLNDPNCTQCVKVTGLGTCPNADLNISGVVPLCSTNAVLIN